MAACRPLPAGGGGSVCFSHSQLLYFVRVAEEGQISRAARTLYIAQPALSQAIGRLERQLGLELLERHPRGVRLTAAGETFLPKAKAAVAAGEDAAVTAQSLARSRNRTMEVGFLSSPPPLTAPGVLERFSAVHRDVELAFRELPFPTAPAAEWLADVDVAVCHSPVCGAGVGSQPLWSEPRAVLLPHTHPLAARPFLFVREVLDEPFCGYDKAVDPLWASFWTLDDHRNGPPELLTSDSPANAMELIAALLSGQALTTFPYSLARTIEAMVPRLAARPLRDATPAWCSLVWRDPPVNLLTLALVEAAGQAAGEPGAQSLARAV